MWSRSFSLMLVLSSLVACKTTKNGNAQVSKDEVGNTIIVAFASIGAGINQEKQAAFLSAIERHQPKLTYTLERWGEEGERDYCLNVSQLSLVQKNELLKTLEKLLGKERTVTIIVNKTCPR